MEDITGIVDINTIYKELLDKILTLDEELDNQIGLGSSVSLTEEIIEVIRGNITQEQK